MIDICIPINLCVLCTYYVLQCQCRILHRDRVMYVVLVLWVVHHILPGVGAVVII